MSGQEVAARRSGGAPWRALPAVGVLLAAASVQVALATSAGLSP